VKHNCHACCEETVMTLTAEDVQRLTSLGFRRFYRENEAGDLQLVNVAGSCVFLDHGRCSVYDHRPEGCWLYPLVIDMDNDEPILHEFCPYRDEFEFDENDEARLRASIEAEDREREERRDERTSRISQFSILSS
jgi:Fe-S-cluster containining protein